MVRARDIEARLSALQSLRTASEAERLTHLREALADRSALVVGRAARLAAELALHTLVPEIAAAFARLMQGPAREDRGCLGKAELAEALYRLGADTPDIFLGGARHVQRDGPAGDSAARLRRVCAFALVSVGHRDVLDALAELLADADAGVRLAAVRALAHREHESGTPLLRLKARSGDADPEVIAEALVALLRIDGARALPFVAGLLDAAERSTVEAALLALGGSRLPGAFEVLRRFFEQTRDPELHQSALTGITMLRLDSALEFVLGLVAEAPAPTARRAVRALALFRDDAELVARLRASAQAREDIDLAETLVAELGA